MNPAILTHTFEPSELAFLQRCLNALCAERGLEGSSVAANDLAVQILHLYQQGVRNERDLHIQLGGMAQIRN